MTQAEVFTVPPEDPRPVRVQNHVLFKQLGPGRVPGLVKIMCNNQVDPGSPHSNQIM